MAQYVATFDSVTKAFSLTRDGVAVTDIDSVCISNSCCYREPDEPMKFSLSVCRTVKDAENKTRTSEYTSAGVK